LQIRVVFYISGFNYKTLIFCRSVRIQLHVDAVLVRELPDGALSRITAFFHTPSVLVNSAQSFDFRQAITLLDNALEHFNSRGSGFVLEYVERFVVSTLRHRPLHGSTYIPTPRFLALKRCIVNVENRDLKCFLWSVLSALYPPKVNKERVTNYLNYESAVDMTGINYPVETKQIPVFEKQNPTISINVVRTRNQGIHNRIPQPRKRQTAPHQSSVARKSTRHLKTSLRTRYRSFSTSGTQIQTRWCNSRV